ncbi:AAA family ATPase [Streptomyces sp. NPDC093516]|uniref:AAA family ATPase n=1 Tax=Streptomyces sp. NPDC093516 TaxID=3155304 RepID=UPI003428C99C
MQKFIVIGVGEFDAKDATAFEGEDFFAIDELEHLDFVNEKAHEISTTLEGAGLLPVGSSPILHPSYTDLTKALKEARSGRTANGAVIHYIGHGLADSDLGVLRLPARDTDLQELGDTSIDVGALLSTIEANQRGPHVLLLLDVCNAGEATRIQALNLISPNRRKAWIIGASTRSEYAFNARFTDAVVETLKRLKDGWLDIHPSLKYVPIEAIASEISLALTRICNKDGSTLPQSLTVTPRTELHDDCPPFFKNPSYQITPHARLLMRAEAEVREFAEQLDEGLDAIHFATRATGAPHQTRMSGRCFFAGRKDQLADLSQWMDEGRGSSLRVVTGSPGAGKSALIGVLVCLSHPDLYEATPAVASKIPSHLQPSYRESIAAVHARGRDLHQILSSIARQLNITHRDEVELTSAHLIQEILNTDAHPVIIVDALDEAVRPVDVMSNLLLPLSNASNAQGKPACRILVGTRPWSQFDVLLKAAERRGGLTNLDEIPSATVERDLKQYIVDLLRDHPFYRSVDQKAAVQQIAESVASILAHRDVVGAFLIAGLFVHQIAAELTAKSVAEICAVVPRSLPQMLELHLTQLKGQNLRWMRPIMAALAHAKGEGMPAAVIQAASVAFMPNEDTRDDTPSRPTDREVAEVLEAASFYLRHSIDSDGRILYRLFHQALADHLINFPLDQFRRTQNKTSDARGLLHSLRSLVMLPTDCSGNFQRNLWKAAPPYLLRHAIQHALDADEVDSLLLDSEFLVHAEPSTLLQLIGYARSAPARLAAAVYRTSAIRHGQANSSARRNILALDASRYGAEELLSSLQSREVKDPGPCVHFSRTTGGELKESLDGYFDGHSAAVTALAAAPIRGNMALVSSSEDGSLRICDIRGGWTLSHIETAHTDWILALKAIAVDGNPILVTAGVDNQIMGWDFSSANVEPFLIGQHSDWVRTIAVHEMDERPIVVSAGDDHVICVWDLTARDIIGDPLVGHKGPVYGLATGRVGGNSLAVSSSRDGEVIVWDLSTRQIIKRFNPFPSDWVRAIAIPEGRSGAFLASDSGHVSVWDLSGFEEINHSSTSHASPIRDVDTAVVEGCSLAITCDADGVLMMWNGQAGAVSFPYVFRGVRPHSLSTSSIEGSPLALIGTKDGPVMSLNLNSDEDLGSPWVREIDEGDPWTDEYKDGVLYAVAIGHYQDNPIVYTGDNAGTISRWFIDNPDDSDVTVYRHNHDIYSLQSVSHSSGDLLVSSTGHGAITICDLVTGNPICTLDRGEGPSGALRHFAIHRLDDHVRIVVGTSQELTVWDVRDPLGPVSAFPRFRDTVTAVAVSENEQSTIYVTGHAGGTIRFWDPDATGEVTRRPRAHKRPVLRIVNVGSPKSMRVASISEDGVVCVWDCRNGERMATYKLRAVRPLCVESMFNKRLDLMAVGYEDGTLEFLDPLSGQKMIESITFPSAVNSIATDDNGLLVACFSQQVSFMRVDAG